MRVDLQHALSNDAHGEHAASTLLDAYRLQVRAALDDHEYRSPESALFAPCDRATRMRIRELVAPFASTKLRTVFLVGIGGSDLGTRAVYEALRPHRNTPGPTLQVLSTIDPCAHVQMRDMVQQANSPDELVLVVVSKSGSTMETLVNANVAYTALRERFGDAANARTIIISDTDAPIASQARAAGICHCPIPSTIGGRYSVFTSVGLVPLSLLGIDIDLFCEGACTTMQSALSAATEDHAAHLARQMYDRYRLGYSIHDFFVWHPELEFFGKWYRQLLSESIGKRDRSGTPVGITPVVAIGSTDLHSLGQLVFGGPRNRFTTFVSAPSHWNSFDTLSSDTPFTHESLRGRESGSVGRAIYEGVLASYRTDRLPFASITLDAISARELGACMALHMGMVLYLARLLDVSAFDQPDVERYKEETRRILSSQNVA